MDVVDDDDAPESETLSWSCVYKGFTKCSLAYLLWPLCYGSIPWINSSETTILHVVGIFVYDHGYLCSKHK